MTSTFTELLYSRQRTLQEGPALLPPMGVVPNFTDPPNHREVGWVVTVIGIVLSTIAVILRMYSKLFCTKKLLAEDYITLVAFSVYGGFQYYAMQIVIYPGYYVHTWDIQLKYFSNFLFNLTASAAIHSIIMLLLKAAILVELVRIFSSCGQRGLFFWACHLCLWTNVIFYTICAFLEIFGCHPREKLWNKALPGGRCINTSALTVASSAINLPSDLIIFILPQRSIWRLNLSWRRRLGVSTVFAFALFACVSAAVRLVRSIPLLYDPDIVYVFASVHVWIHWEITAAFLVIGIPAFPKIFKSSPMLQKWIAILKSWTSSSIEKVDTKLPMGLPIWYRPTHQRENRSVEDGGDTDGA